MLWTLNPDGDYGWWAAEFGSHSILSNPARVWVDELWISKYNPGQEDLYYMDKVLTFDNMVEIVKNELHLDVDGSEIRRIFDTY